MHTHTPTPTHTHTMGEVRFIQNKKVMREGACVLREDRVMRGHTCHEPTQMYTDTLTERL